MTFDEAALRQLLANSEFPKVSLLMPTHGAHAGGDQDPIRYERLVRDVLDEMDALGVDRQIAHELADELRKLPSPGGFWRSQSAGLAVFATLESLEWHRLPVRVGELAVVGVDFQVVEIASVARPPHFAVLAVSRAGVRLFDGTPYELNEVQLPEAPEGLSEVTQYYELERQLQFRQASTVGRGTQVAMFHGHGIGEGRGKEMVLQYLRAVDQSVRKALPGGRDPLVVAGPSEVPSLYAQVSSYGTLVSRHLELNPDGMDAAALHLRALELVEPVFEGSSRAAVDRYATLAGTGKTSDSITDLVPAAMQGRVDTLLLGSSVPIWGIFDPDSAKVEVHDSRRPGDRELVNLAAVHTLRNGGMVVAVDSEAVSGQAALYRF